MIHKLTTDQQKQWLQFAKNWHGYRFAYKGTILQKWEVFSEILVNRISEIDLLIALERNKGKYIPVPSNYHKTKVMEAQI